MRVSGRAYRSIWVEDGAFHPTVIDQTGLPHRFETRPLRDVDEVCEAIRTMRVRGAPLIGATAAYGVALAARVDPSDDALAAAARQLVDTRPTAVNLRHAAERVVSVLGDVPEADRAARARRSKGVWA